ncbi:MAG: hypothetical protein ACFFAN_10930 [Promethearchaeota archaeon]
MNSFQEFQFLLYLTVIILGIQLAVYFFYRYYKIRDERLPLNKILLSFGMFFLLLISGAFILAINKFFITDPIIKEIYNKFGYIPIFFAAIAFLYFISVEEFSKIINLKIAKYLMIVNLIPIIVVIFMPTSAVFTVLIVSIITLLTSIFILIFQIKLIRISKGIIKNRLLLIFIGANLSIASLFFFLEIITSFYPLEIINILFFVGIVLLLTGLIVISLGVYEFPAFYEFKWKENLLGLFIINQVNNNCLYHHDFSERKFGGTGKHYKKLFSGGIIGIDSVLSAITDTRDEKISKIKQADSFILLEYENSFSYQIAYALVVKNDLKSNRYFLKSLKYQFESFYKEMLSEIDNLKGSEEQLFGSFDVIIENIMY